MTKKCSKCQYFSPCENAHGNLRLSGTCELIKDENYILQVNHKGCILPVRPYFSGENYLTKTFYWCDNFKAKEIKEG